MYLSLLEDLGKNDKVYYSIINKIKKGLDLSIKLRIKESDIQIKKESDGK